MKETIEYVIQETVDGQTRALKTVSTKNDSVVLGRADGADIPFAQHDRTVSREQFRMIWEKGRAALENLGKASVKFEGINAPLPSGGKISIRNGVTACFEQTQLHVTRKRLYSQCRLTFRHGTEVKRHKLNTNVSYSIGRAPENDIQLPAASVSARHCTAFPAADGQLGLTDLNSSNGIKIQDGDTVRPLPIGQALGSGDNFILGDVFVSVDFSESMSRRKKKLLTGAGLLALILCVVIMLPGGFKPGSRSSKESIAKVVAVLSEDLPCPSKAGRLSSLSDAMAGADRDLSGYCRKCAELYLSLGKLEQRMSVEQESANLARKKISSNPWSPDSFRYSSDARNIQEMAGRCVALYQEIRTLSEPLRIKLDSTRPSLSDLVESTAIQTAALVSFHDDCSKLQGLIQAAHSDMFSFIATNDADVALLYNRICPDDSRFKEDLEAISRICTAWQTEKSRLQARIEEWERRYKHGDSLPLVIRESAQESGGDRGAALHFQQAPLPATDMQNVSKILAQLSACRTDIDVLSACERSSYADKAITRIQSHAAKQVSSALDDLARQAETVLGASDLSEDRAVKILRGMKILGWNHEKLKRHRDRLVTAMYDKGVDLYKKTVSARDEERQVMAGNLKSLSSQMLEILSTNDKEMCGKFEKLKRAAERQLSSRGAF